MTRLACAVAMLLAWFVTALALAGCEDTEALIDRVQRHEGYSAPPATGTR